MRAGGGELHHHDVATAGIGLAVEGTAITVPTDNNGVSTVHLCQLDLGRWLKLARNREGQKYTHDGNVIITRLPLPPHPPSLKAVSTFLA